MKILLTGSTGYLGSVVLERLLSEESSLDSSDIILLSRREHPVFKGRLRSVIVPEVNFKVGQSAVLEVEPDVIVHCAAMASSNECERQADDAMRVNVDFSEGLAAGAAQVGARMLYVSTDLVFEGGVCPEGGFSEADTPSPITVYARSKLDGERAVLARCQNALVFRICLLYGANRGEKLGPLGWMLHNFRRGEVVPLFYDEWRTPILVDEVASVFELFCRRKEQGVLHLGGPVSINRVEFGRLVAENGGFDPELIRETSRKDNPAKIFRPENVSLNSSFLSEQILKLSLSSPAAGLAKINFS